MVGAGIVGAPAGAVGATEGFGVLEGAVGAGLAPPVPVGGGAGFMVKVADDPLKLFRSSVPVPSPESTELFVIITVEEPTTFGMKVIVTSTRADPLKPGLGAPPVKEISPEVFE